MKLSSTAGVSSLIVISGGVSTADVLPKPSSSFAVAEMDDIPRLIRGVVSSTNQKKASKRRRYQGAEAEETEEKEEETPQERKVIQVWQYNGSNCSSFFSAI